MTKVTVEVAWGETYLDVYTYFKDNGCEYRLLSYLAFDDQFGENGITDGDPEVCDDIPYGTFEHTEEIPYHLVDFVKELTQKAHDRIALEVLRGPPK